MIKLEEVLKAFHYLDYNGQNSHEIEKVVSLDDVNASENCLSWCSDKNLDRLKDINNKSAVIITSENIDRSSFKNFSNIIVTNPRRFFQKVLTSFFLQKRKSGICSSSVVAKDCELGDDIFIGNNVVIEENCTIGNNVVILHNTTIFKGTIIGDNVTIGANTVIGGTGFGYEKNSNGEFELIPHIGNVLIGNNVDIGNNTSIDRAVLGSTVLSDNVKIDNLVHIAHGVIVGRNSVVIANAMVAGSVKIGENSWIAPSSSIINKKSIGSNSLVGLGAVVTKNVSNNTIVAGNPAKFIRSIDT